MRPFKLVEGKNGPKTFLCLNAHIVGQTKHIKDKEILCLTEDQARHVYEKVETGNI